jgi:polyhydroxyalkanoate synthesis regulator phasin
VFLALLLALPACALPYPQAEAGVAASDVATDAAPSGAIRRGRSSSEGFYFNDSFAGDELAEKAEASKSGSAGDGPATEGPSAERLLVREAEFVLEVARVEEEVRGFQQLVESLGGYVSERNDARLTARVPSARFDEAVATLRNRGRVLTERLRALDVTDSVRDLRIRLDNAKSSRERMLEILASAEKVEDVLAVEKELQRLTTEIERLTAQLQTLELRVSMSLLSVAFQPARDVADEPARRPARPSRFRWIRTVGVEHVLQQF